MYGRPSATRIVTCSTCPSSRKRDGGSSPAGVVTVRTSPLRIVENFLDLSHFPYVHTGILGIEPRTEVTDYDVEVRQPEDEIWATQCRFFQPQAAMSADDGQISDYLYRVTSPFVTVLYKTCPIKTGVWDLIGLFVQPLEEDHCDVHTFMLLYDDTTTRRRPDSLSAHDLPAGPRHPRKPGPAFDAAGPAQRGSGQGRRVVDALSPVAPGKGTAVRRLGPRFMIRLYDYVLSGKLLQGAPCC